MKGDQDFMIATLDVRNRIRARLAELNISASTLAGLIGLSDNTMSDFLRGKRSLGNSRESVMLKLLDDLILYQNALRPFGFPLHDIRTTRKLLEHLQKSEITPEMVSEIVAVLVGSNE